MIALDPQPYPIDHIALRGAPDAVALVDKAGVMTFAELEAGVGALAEWLAGRGLSAGDRVATWLPKTRAACLMPLAVARAGLVHVPVNPLLRRAQVAHILGDSGARLLVTQGARAGTLDAGDVPEGCAIVDETDLPLVPRRRPGGPSGPPPSAGEPRARDDGAFGCRSRHPRSDPLYLGLHRPTERRDA
jgi:acyl-coenzyme A synthetase/AMP-(fatty) acid ligase